MMSKNSSNSNQLEEGECPGTSAATPLRKLHNDKLDASKISDSLDRPRKATKKPIEVTDSSDDESTTAETSFIAALSGKSSQGNISIKNVGLLEEREFLRGLSVPDRRDLVGIKAWAEELGDLFDRVRTDGGSVYMDCFDSLSQFRESLELYRQCQLCFSFSLVFFFFPKYRNCANKKPAVF